MPTFAWGLMKGGEYAMSSAVGVMSSGSGIAQNAASIGGSAGIGNVNAFNKSIGNDNIRTSTYSTSGLQFATGAGAVGGALKVHEMTGANPVQQSYVKAFTGGMDNMMGWQSMGGNEKAAMTNIGAKNDITWGGVTSMRSAAGAAGANVYDLSYAKGLMENYAIARQITSVGGGSTQNQMEEGALKIGATKGDMSQVDYYKTDKFLTDATRGGASFRTIGETLAKGPTRDLAVLGAFSQDTLNAAGKNTVYGGWAGFEMKKRFSEHTGKRLGDVYLGDNSEIKAGPDTYRVGPDGKPVLQKTESGKTETHYNNDFTEKNGRTTQIGEDLRTQASTGTITDETLNGDRMWNYREADKTYQTKANELIVEGIKKKITEDLTRQGMSATEIEASVGFKAYGIGASAGGSDTTQDSNTTRTDAVRQKVDKMTAEIRNVLPNHATESQKTERLNAGIKGVIEGAIKEASAAAKVNKDPGKALNNALK